MDKNKDLVEEILKQMETSYMHLEMKNSLQVKNFNIIIYYIFTSHCALNSYNIILFIFMFTE